MPSTDHRPDGPIGSLEDVLRSIRDVLQSEREAASKRWVDFGKFQVTLRRQMMSLGILLAVINFSIIFGMIATWIVLGPALAHGR